MPKKIQAKDLINYKQESRKITCLTAYDWRTAQLLDQAGIDIVLVGDSLANVFLGLNHTQEIGMDEIVYHLKAVSRGIERALLITDMPFGSIQVSHEQAIENALTLVRNGAEAVKIEGANPYQINIIDQLIQNGIPIIGHLGYIPQSSHLIGHGKIQGKEEDDAKKLIEQALQLEALGVSAIVLELIPAELATEISNKLSIPTIGIGSGPNCDGQVLVSDDMLGKSNADFKFIKKYAKLNEAIINAAKEYIQEVKDGEFPA